MSRQHGEYIPVTGPRPNAKARDRLMKVLTWLDGGGDTHIDGVRVKFKMDDWLDTKHRKIAGKFVHCGTACCIGGYIDVLNGNATDITAASWAGLTDEQRAELFVPFYYDYTRITVKEAAECLRHVIETGTVDWKRAKRIVREQRKAAKA